MIYLGEYPARSDAWGHLAKAEHLAKLMHEEGLSAYFRTAWFPNWYLGDPFRTYYPPLTTLVLTPIIYFIPDPLQAHHFFSIAVFTLFGLLTYVFIRYCLGDLPAAFGAILAIWAPYQLRTLFFEGNYPRSLALLGLPLIALLFEKLLSEEKRRMPNIFALGLCWSWVILAHAQQAFIFAIAFGIYILARLFLDPDVPFLWAVPCITGIAFGALFAAPWLLPAYSHAEFPQIPYLPMEKVELFSATLAAIRPSTTMSDGQILFGFGAIIMALLATIARPSPRKSAWFITGIIALWLSLGSKGALFSLLPFNHLILPERFINFSAFALAFTAAGLLPIGNRARYARVGAIIILAYIDFLPGSGLLSGKPYPTQEASLSQISKDSINNSRAALLTYPEPVAPEVYYAGQEVALINGWALENTPHHNAFRRTMQAPSWGWEYFTHQLSIWNVGNVILKGYQKELDPAQSSLEKAGFFHSEDIGPYEIWKTENPTGMIQDIPQDRMLIFGDTLTPMLTIFPFAEEAGETPILSSDDLAEYPAVGLYNFQRVGSNLLSDQPILEQYLDQGGVLIVDLSGMEDSIGAVRGFLDVSPLRISLDDSMSVRWKDEGSDIVDDLTLDLGIGNSWSGAIYEGLDVVIAEVAFSDHWYPILGYKTYGEGKTWFIGMNLPYYLKLYGPDFLGDRILDLTLADVNVSRAVRFESIPYKNWIAGPTSVKFITDSMHEHEEALISYTYSPRWSLRMDGQELPFGSYENLIKLDLPAGQHVIEMQYQPYGTLWPIFGLVIGVLTFTGALTCVFVEKRRADKSEITQTFTDNAEEVEYISCPFCGFKLAEMHPSISTDSMQNKLTCPICKYHRTPEATTPGQKLSPPERDSQLEDWLHTHDYDPKVVYAKWGFDPDTFFDPADPSPE